MTRAMAFLGLGVCIIGTGCGNTMMEEMGVGWTGASGIQADLRVKCSTNNAACHSPAATTNMLKVDEGAGKEQANYDAVIAKFVNKGAPAQSSLLTKPLDMNHGGGLKFASTNDATYQKWLKWIMAGAPFTPPAAK